MFSPKQNLSARLTDVVDLLIDFATLGEYGLEPVGKTDPTCDFRQRPTAPTGTTRQRRPGQPSPSSSPRRSRIEGPFLLRP